ncbi:HAD family hydrolase [Rhodococcus sp. 24CO]|uniref:HAD family hydrolase n=1 Tax=Rhodococcus sp. 24CO TaxID=3117460 RepID=UPI003D32FB12
MFDNDGTLWPEKPMPVQVHFIVEQWRVQAASSTALAEIEPYRSALDGDYGWLAQALEKHAGGDDTDLRIAIGAITHASDCLSVTDYAASVAEFIRTAQHPTLHRPYPLTAYQPMVELLRFLADNSFSCYIVSGGDRDFMRPIVEQCYGIPPERVIGSALGLRYDNTIGDVRYGSSFEFMDDGPEKPARIWSRIGRRPLFAAGNSDGDAQMLDYALAGNPPGFGLVVHHDDSTRNDTPYDTGAHTVLGEAASRGYTVASVQHDWDTIFAPAGPRHIRPG